MESVDMTQEVGESGNRDAFKQGVMTVHDKLQDPYNIQNTRDRSNTATRGIEIHRHHIRQPLLDGAYTHPEGRVIFQNPGFYPLDIKLNWLQTAVTRLILSPPIMAPNHFACPFQRQATLRPSGVALGFCS